jgi:hypothetical protein
MTEQWMSMRTAARRLGVSPNKISRLASKGRITTRENPLDERVRLVDYNELKALFESAPQVVTDKSIVHDESKAIHAEDAANDPE